VKPLLIGLSGPIGCGKSTVARMLAELGGVTIDADQLARRVADPGGEALPAIRARFGDAVIASDGELDRAALAQVVFHDASALADLEGIVHPHVRRLIDRRLAEAERDEAPFVVIEAIKLVEGGLADRCDEVWLIECQPATQRSRLATRGAQPDDIERRMAAQGPELVDRLIARLGDRPGVRRLSTDRAIDETRSMVEDALADAIEAA
jgi:dephospho-CoA kinase